MRIETFLAGASALCLALTPATALAQKTNIIGGGVWGDGKPAASGYTGPGDITTFTAWWGFRAYSAAKASAGALAANIRRASDNEQCDFPVTSAGGLGNSKNCTGADNGESLATFLSATSGYVAEMYDQTGNGWNVLQGTAANQPTVNLTGINSLPTGVYSSSSMATSGAITPASGVVSGYAVYNRTSCSSNCRILSENASNNRPIFGNATANQVIVDGASGSVTATAADSTAHNVIGIINGASSSAVVDGAQTTGSATGNTSAGQAGLAIGSTFSGDISEAGFVDNVALNSTQYGNLCHNARLYWNTGGSC